MGAPFRGLTAASRHPQPPLEHVSGICDESFAFCIRFSRALSSAGQMDVKPRKSPRQARAKATVEAIVEATTQVLLEDGYERFTTARAAERAGVSVGSLYQYFPNKAALASAVIDRCCENFLIAFETVLAGQRHVTLAECVRAIIEETFISHHLTPELHRIVLDLAPRIGVAEKTEYVSGMMVQAIEAMLRKHSDEIAPDIDLATAAMVIETTLEALAHRAVLAHPAHPQGETLAKEATRLVTRYLTSGVNAMADKTTKKPAKAAKKAVAKRVAAKPTLLAGGNPQIAKGDGDAPVQAYIAAMPGWKSDVGRRLDALIVRTVPGVRKAVKWNSPFYGVEGQGWFLSFHCFTKYVKVAFFRGTALRPVPPGASKHEDVRYLDIHEDDQLDDAQLVAWVTQASRLPGERL